MLERRGRVHVPFGGFSLLSSTSIPLTANASNISAENQRVAREHLSRLNALAKSEDFAWYVENVLQPLADRERDAALSVARPADESERARWRHDLAREILGLPKRLRTTFETILAGGH